MKRFARAAVAALLSLGLLAQPTLAAEQKIQIVLQGAPVQFDADPFVENSRTLVPLRTLSERLGFMVEWEDATQKITLTKFPTKVVLWVGKTEAEVNGQPFTLEVAPKIVAGRTFVPLRFISEHLGANVFWNGDKNEVRVTPKGQSDPEAVSLLMAKPTEATAGAQANQQMHADIWLKVTETGTDPVEMKMTMDLQAQGQEIYGNVDLRMPMMGANVPMLVAQLAIKNGFIWAKVEGGLLASQLGGTVTTQEWQPIGPLTALNPETLPTTGPTPKLTPEELEQIGKELIDQLVVTFGPSEVKDGKKLLRLDVDMSKVDFIGLLGKIVGEPASADLRNELDLKMTMLLSVLMEEETKSLRGLKMEAKIGDDELVIEMKLDMTVDPSTTPITWPTDLPAEPPADGTGLPIDGLEPPVDEIDPPADETEAPTLPDTGAGA